MKLCVGNLALDTGEAELRSLFAQHGEVASAAVVVDPETGKSSGLAFIEMTDRGQARAAISAIDGQPFRGLALSVTEARTLRPSRRDPAEREKRAGTGGRGGW